MMQHTKESTFIGTANHGYGQHAQEEIRRLFGAGAKFVTIVPAEIFIFTLNVDKSEATRRLVEQEPMFLRHMQPVDEVMDWNAGTPDQLRQMVMSSELALPAGAPTAVQIRKTEQVGSALAPGACKQIIDAVLEERFQAVPVVKDAQWTLSLFLTEERVYLGLSKPEHNLSDWSGGAIRFRKEDGQISRAKFKLLEAERAFGLDFSQYRSAIDIGAAPGGWTSFLLERGLQVTAVDPAKLDASLLRNPKLKFIQKNAGDVKFAPQSFDLLVCDMSWSPRQMSRLVKGLLYSLIPGGTAIITVKLMHKKPFQTVRELVEDVQPELMLQKAKQLFHNREELTLFLIKG
ncbi:SAM-dependent methyltransferase [Paenibacillus rigui]|uniref:SAM-dependent methyltransferase n=2 Tax=Paenibacillus rigui TaxID=554312 RepID=A0A229UY14_9BACL|nr:SAM-dependent methyltransferase [Paenibacillus rigui]